jgi:hypothetical protein
VLSEANLALIEQAFDAKVANPPANATYLFPNDAAITYEIMGYSAEEPLFAAILRDTPLVELSSGVFGGGPVWYLGEQVWLKKGGHARRTVWHQDSAYYPFSGSKSAVLWVPLISLPVENVLEVVRGTHVGPTYNGSAGEGAERELIYDEADWDAPELPDIDAEPNKWRIFAEPMNRGDVLVFHTNAIHGGAPTFPDQVRKTMSFRVAGDDVVYTPRPPMKRFKVTGESATDFIERQQGARFLRAFDGLESGAPISGSPGLIQVHA